MNCVWSTYSCIESVSAFIFFSLSGLLFSVSCKSPRREKSSLPGRVWLTRDYFSLLFIYISARLLRLIASLDMHIHSYIIYVYIIERTYTQQLCRLCYETIYYCCPRQGHQWGGSSPYSVGLSRLRFTLQI